MRILTLVSDAQAIPHATRLAEEIRTFNAEIDFRLRFLHVEIEEICAVPHGLGETARNEGGHSDVFEVPVEDPLEAAARLALAVAKHRPEILVVVGSGALVAAGHAAARACGTRAAHFGAPDVAAGTLDLGDVASTAVERLTGVAREFR